MSSIQHRLDRYGLALQAVEAPPPALSWTYTIGLEAGYDHPELVIIGGALAFRGWALNTAGEMIAGGHHFVAGVDTRLDDVDVQVRSVHPHHVDNGLVATWCEYYASIRQEGLSLEVLQVVLPTPGFCPDHQPAGLDLSDPLTSWDPEISAPPDVPGSNVRAERRRHERAAAKRRAIELRHLN